jgi:hypothetical protein
VTRKRDRRQRVESEDANFQHLVSRRDLLTDRKAASVGDHDDARRSALRAVIHIQHRLDLDRCPDLFAALANHGFGRAFVVVDEAARQTPQAVPGLDRTPAEDDATAGFDHDRGGDLGVAPQHEVVVRTRFELATFEDPDHEGRPATNAEVAHGLRG